MCTRFMRTRVVRVVFGRRVRVLAMEPMHPSKIANCPGASSSRVIEGSRILRRLRRSRRPLVPQASGNGSHHVRMDADVGDSLEGAGSAATGATTSRTNPRAEGRSAGNVSDVPVEPSALIGFSGEARVPGAALTGVREL